jgi:hypothetical protein
MAGAATCASGQDFLQQRQHGNLAGRVLFNADSGPAPPNLTKAAPKPRIGAQPGQGRSHPALRRSRTCVGGGVPQRRKV